MSLVGDALKGLKDFKGEKVKNETPVVTISTQQAIYEDVKKAKRTKTENIVQLENGLLVYGDNCRIVTCPENIELMKKTYLDNNRHLTNASLTLGITPSRFRSWMMTHCKEFYLENGYASRKKDEDNEFRVMVGQVYNKHRSIKALYRDCVAQKGLKLAYCTFEWRMRDKMVELYEKIKSDRAIPDRQLYDKVWESLLLNDQRIREGKKRIPYKEMDWAKDLKKSQIDYLRKRVRIIYGSK